MTYKITEITNDVNELKMLIRYSLTGQMCGPEDVAKIDPYLNGKKACVLAIPLEMGTIGSIEGMEQIAQMPQVYFTTQYYSVGGEITEKKMSTLDQLFARFTIIADDKEQLLTVVNKINSVLSVKDTAGNEMYIQRFDPKRFF